jgi:hypothetical protein
VTDRTGPSEPPSLEAALREIAERMRAVRPEGVGNDPAELERSLALLEDSLRRTMPLLGDAAARLTGAAAEAVRKENRRLRARTRGAWLAIRAALGALRGSGPAPYDDRGRPAPDGTDARVVSRRA